MITQFALVNEYGQSYILNNLNVGLFSNPKGMGYELDCDYTLVGNAWVRNYRSDKQAKITGSIVYASAEPYKAQTALLKFIRTSKELKLSRTTAAGTYYKDVDITKYNINRVKKRALSCDVTLQPRSLWYAEDLTNYTISTLSDNAMRYAYTFPATFKGSVDGTIDIYNDGSVEAPFTVSFIGPIVNPSLVLTQDSVEIARIDIIGEAEVGETIEYSTVDGDLYCYRKKTTGDVNLVGDLDIANDNFFKIPIGSSQIKLSADADITQPVIFTVRKLYRAV